MIKILIIRINFVKENGSKIINYTDFFQPMKSNLEKIIKQRVLVSFGIMPNKRKQSHHGSLNKCKCVMCTYFTFGAFNTMIIGKKLSMVNKLKY